MEAGAPFPDLYDWTWGEINDFIDARAAARKQELRENANMYFRTVALHMRMLNAEKNQKFSVMDVYEFLWTRRDRMLIRMHEARERMEISARKRKSEHGPK